MNKPILLEDVPGNCPKCDYPGFVVAVDIEGYRLKCAKCGYSTKRHEKKQDAIREWNESREKEKR